MGTGRPRPAELWTVDDVAEFLRVPVRTLYRWNYDRTGPRCYRVGRELRYDPRDVWEWVQHPRN